MSAEPLPTVSPAISLDQLYRRALEAAEELTGEILLRMANSESFARLDRLLGALPLPQQRYSWVAARLANARAYVLGNEPYAAAYEARLLTRRLAVESSLAGRPPIDFRFLHFATVPNERPLE
jgi:hypothetical protein